MNREEIQIVDAHVHLFPNREVGRWVVEEMKREYGAPYYCTGSPEELAENMKRAGISHAVVLNQASAKKEALNNLIGGNFFICAHARQHPELIPAIGLDTRMRRNPVAEIEHKLKWGARAVKLHPLAQEFYPNDKAMWPIYQKCEEAKLPIIFHCGHMMVERLPAYAHPDLFHDVLSAFPKLKVVLAHMGGGFWDEAKKLADAFPDNAYFDTAIAISGSPIPRFLWLNDVQAKDMIRHIGAHRVMFGTDFPWVDPKQDIARISRLDLTDKEKRMILSENASTFFGIQT